MQNDLRDVWKSAETSQEQTPADSSIRRDNLKSITRRPVPKRSVPPVEVAQSHGAFVGGEQIVVGEVRPDLDEQLEHLQLETEAPSPQLTHVDDTLLDGQSTVSKPTQGSTPSMFQVALSEVKHFAGGLIAHPYEATKHYSIMRHSHGLVYYQGPTTSVAITVFSDQPLPQNRKLWLQKRGFSGKTGLKVGAALGSRSAWIDVTPTITATADLLPVDDERAWQRDISKFMRKARDAKHIRDQHPYETDIVRIPHIAEDGYFRIVLCADRKVLCPSPIFRYVTASLSPGHLRGANLSMLPVELGIKLGAYVARNAANTAAHGALQPAVTAYQNSVQPVIQQYNPMGLTRMAAQAAYDETGAAARVQAVEQEVSESYARKVAVSQQLAIGQAPSRHVELVGDPEGPRSPYPIKCSGLVVNGSEGSSRSSAIPILYLYNVPEDVLLRLSGRYIAWASVLKAKGARQPPTQADLYGTWHPALVIVKPSYGQKVKVVEQKEVAVHLINDFENAIFMGARLKLMLMAFLRPVDPHAIEANAGSHEEQDQISADIATVRASLDRPTWSADITLQRVKSIESSRSMTERIADVQDFAQRQTTKVPLHRLGIKTDEMGLRDQLIGTGGICVRR